MAQYGVETREFVAQMFEVGPIAVHKGANSLS
jgi:hypothetical protein